MSPSPSAVLPPGLAPGRATGRAKDAVALHHLRLETRRLRLLIERRIRYLRRGWSSDPLQGYQGSVISDARIDLLVRGPARAAELELYLSDELADVRIDLEEAQWQIEACLETLASQGQDAPLEVLVARLGLSRFEREILLLGMASEIEADFDKLFAYLHDDQQKRLPSVQLAQDLLLDSDDLEVIAGARAVFAPEAPLRRFRLIELDASSPSTLGRLFSLAPRTVEFLLGSNSGLGGWNGLLTAGEAPSCDPQDQIEAKKLADLLSEKASWPAVLLVGPPCAGAEALASAAAQALGRELLVVNGRRLPSGEAERLELKINLEREAILRPAALFFEVEERSAEAGLGSLIETLGVPAFFACREALAIEREHVLVRLERPSADARRAQLQRALGGGFLGDERLGELIEHFELSSRTLRQVVAAARDQARRRGAAAPSFEDLWAGCRQQIGRDLETLAQRLEPRHDWSDLILPPETEKLLRALADQVMGRAKVYETWGFGKKLSRGRGITALFSGASGTGKTLAVEVLAAELGLDCFRVEVPAVVSKYIGETEKNLRRVFDAAEASGAVLFFDEADALFGKRSEVKDSHDRYANLEISYLLQRMEDHRGLAILATNLKANLDQAFLRRLRFVIDFPFPDLGQRRRIWQRAFPATLDVTQIDFEALARLEVAGGNIHTIALNAAFLAAAANAKLGMEHLMVAARREYQKIGKLLSSAEFGAYLGLAKS